MRKMFVCCISALGIWGIVLSSDAMLPEDNRSDVQFQGQLVPVSEMNGMLEINDWERLGRDWSRLHEAFFDDLVAGGTENFEELFSPRAPRLHSVCRFVAKNVFGKVLTSSERPKLDEGSKLYGKFRENTESLWDLIGPNLVNGGRYIDSQTLVDLLLMKMDGLVPETVESSIEAGISKIVSARTNTVVEEEEFKQAEFRHKQKLLELEFKEKRLKMLYMANELRRQSADIDKEEFNLEQEKWRFDRDKEEASRIAREREEHPRLSMMKDILKDALPHVPGVVSSVISGVSVTNAPK